MNACAALKKCKREARSGCPKARLRIIYMRFLEMIIRCVTPEPPGDLYELRI